MYNPRISMKKVKDALSGKLDNMTDTGAAKARAKFYNRWAKISGGEPIDDKGNYNPNDIDWDNEFVRLEWYMCDPSILTKLGDDKYRDKGLALIPEELHETY